MTELSKEEIKLINKMVESYWVENNRSHIENEEEWNLTLNLVKKLTIPVVSQQRELFADQDSKEFILWQRDMQIQRIDNNVYKWREFTYNREFFLEKYLEHRNKANCG